MMKHIIIIVAVIAVVTFIFFLMFTDTVAENKEQISEPLEDGYVKETNNKDALKKTESCEITSFSLVFSTEAWIDDEYFEAGKYNLSARKDTKTVRVEYDFTTRHGEGERNEFDTDANFLVRLDEIVKKYDLARHNGHSRYVSGLPDMYGEKLIIDYASGERIYAFDNQDGFIDKKCLCEIYQLFLKSKTKNG